MAKARGLDVWLNLGQKVNIRGREFYMMPLPLKQLRIALELLGDRTREFVKDFVTKAESNQMDLLRFASDVLDSFDATELVYQLLTLPKDPETGKPINDVTKEWLAESLDIPTVRMLGAVFVEVNEIEEVLKKDQSLPGLTELMDALKMTYGIALLKSSHPSTTSLPGRSQDSQSPKSTDTSKSETLDGKSSAEAA